MMVNKGMQQGAKAGPGDAVRMTLAVDTDAKTVEIPSEIKQALAKNKAAATAPSHRREHIRHIREAKKPETQKRRIEQMIRMLLDDDEAKRP
jgi:uncharacterized protein YdeI (YjbR/CyaY-like superfamily)